MSEAHVVTVYQVQIKMQDHVDEWVLIPPRNYTAYRLLGHTGGTSDPNEARGIDEQGAS
jgi:hypothetical protein